MFDTPVHVERDQRLDAALSLLSDHGSRLADAARSIVGPSAEARVAALGRRLAEAPRMTARILHDLEALHALLALEFVPEDGPGEVLLLLDSDLTSPEVHAICLLTDLLAALLETIGNPAMLRPLALDPAWPHPQCDDRWVWEEHLFEG